MLTDRPAFKGVIFDLDGTLLDTLEDLADSMNAVLGKMNLPQHPLTDYRYFVGKGMHNLVRNALPPDMREEGFVDSCFDRMFVEYGKRWDRKTRIYNGIPELLEALTVTGIRMSIVSNKAQHFTIPVVEKYLSRWKFCAVFGERQGVPRKPDPVSLIEAAEIMGLSHEEIVCLGDSGSDMTSALNAGMFPAGALWGFRGPEELISSGAEILIEHPMELLKLNFTK